TLLNLLRRPFELLVGGPRDAPARQQTLRATLDWSYGLLDHAEQTLFRRLAVFSGGCTLAAVAAVCTEDPKSSGIAAVLPGLGSLVEKSLLHRVDGIDGERYIMLTTIQEYALEYLKGSGEVDKIRQRHTAFFLRWAETAEASLHGPEHGVWLQRLEAEHNNLR